jgi:hypothetical protein
MEGLAHLSQALLVEGVYLFLVLQVEMEQEIRLLGVDKVELKEQQVGMELQV